MFLPDSWRSPLDPERVLSRKVTHWEDDHSLTREEQLTVEEPLEVRIGDQRLAIIMRTPGNDIELVLGFLLAEGLLADVTAVQTLSYALDAEGLPLPNVLRVELAEAPDSSPHKNKPLIERRFAVSSSCGLCGADTITDVLSLTPPLENIQEVIFASTFYALPERLRAAQSVFTHTGGLHAAGLFNFSGELQFLREDVGRHNALDKLIGYGLQQQLLPFDHSILLMSGRTSFEIIQKALFARIPCIAAISAPSSLAVELAEKGGITLIGFLRDRSMNVYTHPERIA